MTTQRVKVLQALVDWLKPVLPDGHEGTVDDSTDPIRDLGLESADGLEFACSMEAKLGIIIPEELNPFVDERAHTRSVGQIVDFLTNCFPKGEEGHGRKSSS